MLYINIIRRLAYWQNVMYHHLIVRPVTRKRLALRAGANRHQMKGIV